MKKFITCFKKKSPKIYSAFKYFLLIPWIAKFVLSLLLFYFIEEGDIGKYSEFLECKYVNKEFFKKFDDVEFLVLIFEIFVVINLVSEVLDKIIDFVDLFLENAQKELEEMEKEKENKSKEAVSGDESKGGLDIKINNLE